MPEHTEECLRQQEQARQAQEAYIKAWPRYCHFCNAEGGCHGTENVGERNYPVMQSYFDPCPVCMEHGRCPRCGEQTFDLSEKASAVGAVDEVCTKCSWNINKPDAPPTLRCICDAEFP